MKRSGVGHSGLSVRWREPFGTGWQDGVLLESRLPSISDLVSEISNGIE